MGYLSNLNNEIIIDAILTKYGREKLAQGQQLNITKFALSDDEVDYILYNTNNPYGSDYYDIAIRKMPVLEPVPNSPSSLRYRLFTSATTVSYPYTVQVSYPTEFESGIWQANSTYIVTPYLDPVPDATTKSGVWYQFDVPNLGSFTNFLKVEGVIDSNIGVPGDLMLAQQEWQQEVNEGRVPTWVAGHYMKVSTLSQIPYRRASLTITVTGKGAALSSRPSSVPLVLDRMANTSNVRTVS